MKTELFEYNLDESLIAKYPPKERGTTNLLVYGNFSKGKDQILEHKKYPDVVDYIKEGSVVVLNNTKVVQARFFVHKKDSDRKIQLLYLNNINYEAKDFVYWEVLLGNAKKINIGEKLFFSNINGEFVEIITKNDHFGTYVVKINPEYEKEFFEKYGHVPLPPYLKRDDEESDKKRYNTVFAKVKGSVASPTASLNITEKLLSKMKNKGIKIVYITLDVGWGTFAPVKTDQVEAFEIHEESFSITEESAKIINETIKNGNEVIAFGTTVSRVLETVAKLNVKDSKYYVKARNGKTKMFIYPGYKWKIVNGLVTNFHTPRSSLLMLVSSFIGEIIKDQKNGIKKLLELYIIAQEKGYKFLSYGDSCFFKR